MLCVERRRAAWTTASLWLSSSCIAFSAGRTQRRWRRRDCGDNQSERETAWLRGTVGERQRGPRHRRARQAARCLWRRRVWRRTLAIHLCTEMILPPALCFQTHPRHATWRLPIRGTRGTETPTEASDDRGRRHVTLAPMCLEECEHWIHLSGVCLCGCIRRCHCGLCFCRRLTHAASLSQ